MSIPQTGDGTIAGLTSLIFPVYNPGKEMERIWEAVNQFLNTAPGRWEVVFVCDGCTDGTVERLSSLVEPVKERVWLIVEEKNRGKGHAIRQGLARARGEWRIFTDIDLSYGLDGVSRVAQKLWAGHNVVVGSRMLPESSFVIPAHLQDYAYRRRIQSAIFSRLVRWMLPLQLSDTQAGLKGFSTSAAQTILPYMQCDGFSFDCELLLICHFLGLPIVEVPVQFVFYDDASTTSLRKTLRMVRDLWRIRRRLPELSAQSPTIPAAEQINLEIA